MAHLLDDCCFVCVGCVLLQCCDPSTLIGRSIDLQLRQCVTSVYCFVNLLCCSSDADDDADAERDFVDDYDVD